MTPRFFVPPPLFPGVELALPSSAAHHAVRVLRLERGDAVTLFDGRGGEYAAEIRGSTSRGVNVAIVEHRPVERESPFRVTLVQALIAADRMDAVIQKAVELGASAIAPVVSARCVTRFEEQRAARRVEHWRQIVIASCEQCGRNRLPDVQPPLALAVWLNRHANGELRVLLSPSAQVSLDSLPAPRATIDVLVGPEGGLAPEEEAAAIAADFHAVRLGTRILRTETAGPAMLAALNALWGDWR
jgi:16S rRNA (uracil1498-N3)-methyltransferase